MKCRICGSDIMKPIYVYDNMVHNVSNLYTKPTQVLGEKDIPIFSCFECGHYQIPFIEVDDNYYLMSAGSSPKLMALEEDELQQLSISAPSNEKLLEVGCGDGTFLQNAQKYFQKCVGIEPSDSYVKLCKSKGLEVIQCYLDNKYKPKQLYDAVVARQVFEHIDNPYEVFTAMCSVLKENGVLFIEVPNGKKSISQNRYFDFFCDHVNYYTMESLMYLATHHGMTVFNIGESFGGDYLQMLCKKNIQQELTLDEQIKSDAERFMSIISTHERVALYGAGAKAQVVFMQLTNSLAKVVKVFDTDPLKAGRYLGNAKVPIELPNSSINKSDAIVILAKSYADEISLMLKNQYNYKGDLYIL